VNRFKTGKSLFGVKDRQKHQEFVHSNQKQAKELPNSGIQFLEQHVAAPSLILSPSLDICGKRKSIKCRVMNFPTLFLSFLRFWMIELDSAIDLRRILCSIWISNFYDISA